MKGQWHKKRRLLLSSVIIWQARINYFGFIMTKILFIFLLASDIAKVATYNTAITIPFLTITQFGNSKTILYSFRLILAGWWHHDHCSFQWNVLWKWSSSVRSWNFNEKLCWTFWGFDRLNPASKQQLWATYSRRCSCLVLYL